MGSVGPTLAELGDADLLVLWAMRRWLVARRNGEHDRRLLQTQRIRVALEMSGRRKGGGVVVASLGIRATR